ncbi:MAG: hypothetical protein QOJ79_560 [Actinomycetota bacterium]|jgi:hypothetical protein|nr:hypothetical protein [Actinomycetota bacterium]
MSADVSLPAPRQQPVEVMSVDSSVALGCSGCHEELRLPLEPVAPMLDAIGDFVRRHAACQ